MPPSGRRFDQSVVSWLNHFFFLHLGDDGPYLVFKSSSSSSLTTIHNGLKWLCRSATIIKQVMTTTSLSPNGWGSWGPPPLARAMSGSISALFHFFFPSVNFNTFEVYLVASRRKLLARLFALTLTCNSKDRNYTIWDHLNIAWPGLVKCPQKSLFR